MSIELWSLVVSCISAIIAGISLWQSRKTLKMQNNIELYEKKIEAYKKLQDYFASRRYYYRSDSIIYNSTFVSKPFEGSRKLLFKEIEDLFGKDIIKEVNEIDKLCAKACGIDSAIVEMFQDYEEIDPNKNDNFKEAIHILHSGGNSEEEYKEAIKTLDNFEITYFNSYTEELEISNYLDYYVDLESLKEKIENKIIQLNKNIFNNITLE